MRLIESVPNFSEGKRKEIIESIVDEARVIKGVMILDYSSDPDHNRSVVTLVGEVDPMLEVLFNMTKKAAETIDLRKHSGEHPRMGATDVIPLVPISNVTKDECIELSRILGKRIADELNVPVYLYEKSATSKERKDLSKIRKGEFEGFKDKIKKEEWKPDYGKAEIHESAGVTAVGCREFLIAYNVNLGTDNIDIAKKIARAVRHISGGFRYVKALGFALEERGIVQVSMNLTNYKKSKIHRIFELIKLEAERYGVPVIGSEIVGMVPLDALVDVAEFYLKLEGFDMKNIIEHKIMEEMMKDEN
ncbi:MAG: glutamate formimidoyltransferase [Petrotogales bacterium]